jgi:hypothetical protein
MGEAKGFALKFREVILENSNEKFDFTKACQEWYRCDLLEKEKTNCVCGKEIKEQYIIYHLDGRTLSPIGSSCVKKIGNNNHLIIDTMDEATKNEKFKKKFGKKIFNYGKHNGDTYEEMFNDDPNYCKWVMYKSNFGTKAFYKGFFEYMCIMGIDD